MKAMKVRAVAALVSGLVLVTTAGCVRVELPEPKYETADEAVNAGTATEIRASLDMGAGELHVSGTAPSGKVMEAAFEYSPPSWRPVVDYDVTAGVGRLSVRTPSHLDWRPLRGTRYVWDVALTDELPLDLSVNMGAGESTIELAGTDLRRLKLNLGAGDTTIDLSGKWTHDAEIDVTAGAGELVVRVPADVGVRIRGYKGGIGEFRADGFSPDGDAVVNDAYGDADVTFEITVSRGVGEVRVETVE